jgi:hypothetical protein
MRALPSEDGAPEQRVIYRSSNGDQWFLVRDAASKRVLVRHQPNRASGGRASLTEIDVFLSEGHGPQHEALLRLLRDAGLAATHRR